MPARPQVATVAGPVRLMPAPEAVSSVTPKPTMAAGVPKAGLAVMLIGDGAIPVTGAARWRIARSLSCAKLKAGLTVTLDTATRPAWWKYNVFVAGLRRSVRFT